MMIAAEELSPGVPRPLSRAEYEHLIDLGCFEGERVELLRGVIVTMPPQGDEHENTITLLTSYLVRAVGPDYYVRPQLSLAAADDSLPEPDFSVIPRSAFGGRPRTAALVVEVAYSSLRIDRGIKAQLYAEAGVPEYWIANVKDGVVEVYTEPGASGYGQMKEYRPGDRIALVAIPGVTVAVSEFLWVGPGQRGIGHDEPSGSA